MAPDKRVHVETGIRRDQYGYDAYVHAGGRTVAKRFKPSVPLTEIRRWRERTRAERATIAKIAKEDARAVKRSPSGWCYIYFIRSGDTVKIGRAVDVSERLRTFQTSHPADLALLAAIPGHAVLEPAIHQRFQHLHAHGEWFYLADDLLRFIRAVKAGWNPIAWLWKTDISDNFDTDLKLGAIRNEDGAVVAVNHRNAPTPTPIKV